MLVQQQLLVLICRDSMIATYTFISFLLTWISEVLH